MTHKIFEIKKKLIDEVESEIERMGSIKNIDTRELGMVIDMIKDLAEAEEKCWKACYYKSVVEAMEMSTGGNIERIGYMPEESGMIRSNTNMGYQGSMGYQNYGGSHQSGGSTGYSNRMGSMGGRSGYSDQSIQNIKQMMEAADPQRREQLKQDLMRMMQEVGI